MSNGAELRGSTPVYSAKDVLQRVDRTLEALDHKVDELVTETRILASQNLDTRLRGIESWQNRLIGLAGVGALLALLATILAILNRVPPVS